MTAARIGPVTTTDRGSVVVTGAHGFIGRYTARFLAETGFKVIGIGHGSWSEEEWRSWGIEEWHHCDIEFQSLVAFCGKPVAIMHCAGSGSVPFSLTNPREDFRRNVEATLDVLEFIRVLSPQTKLVYPSSASIYGDTKIQPISETTIPDPISPYGVHKWMGEQLIRSYSRSFGIASGVVRFFSVYGNGLRKQLLWDACRKISEGDLLFMGSGEEIRDWLHVSDAASLLYAMIAAASNQCPVVNGGTGEGLPVSKVITSLAEALGTKSSMIRFSGAKRAGDPSRFVACIESAQALGWSPHADGIEAITNYATWWLRER